ncbi:MAG: toll/interleukin-1 receptor domain-containing protein [Clostridia bacterium]|nr:toll/interleukin-1 receptor domain-containing protein [Clostridia bacterium]
MGYAFISYSSKNQQYADAIRALFAENRISTWMAPYDIPVGSQYAKEINRAIREASCVVLILTEASMKSIWVAKEIERAVNYRKPIIPIRAEDGVKLNDEFELYISTNQVIAVPKIDKNSYEIKKLLRCVIGLTDTAQKDRKEEPHDVVIEVRDHSSQSKRIDITIWSPVVTDVYLNSYKQLILKVDPNSGFDYAHNTANVAGEFVLLFKSKGFEKQVTFDADTIDRSLEYRLKAILSSREIQMSYDREDALWRIENDPTGYAFDQIASVGREEDIAVLSAALKRMAKVRGKDTHSNYLIASCAYALGKLAIKFDKLEDVAFVADIYESYDAKPSYGWMFTPVLEALKKAR